MGMKRARLIKNFIFCIVSTVMILSSGCNHISESDKKIKYVFKVDQDENLSNLNVNLYLYKYDSGSKWYSLVKKKTVIENGQVISPIIDADADHHSIEVYLPNIRKELTTNHIYTGSDYIFDYTFNSTGINALSKVSGGGHNVENKNFKPYLDIPKNIPHDFMHYNAENTTYEPDNIKESLINELKTMSFEELKTTDKIFDKDLMKLNHLSFEEKQQLIKIHQVKKLDLE